MSVFDLLIGFVFGLMFGSIAMLWAVKQDMKRALGEGTEHG